MSLRDRIGDEMREAMKARDQERVSTLRMLMTAFKNREVEVRHPLEDEEALEVIGKEAKRRRESIEAYRAAAREDLAAKEESELRVLQGYLPEAMPEEELQRLVDEAIAETGATDAKQMGLVMKALMPKVKGRADGNAVSAMVRARLGA